MTIRASQPYQLVKLSWASETREIQRALKVEQFAPYKCCSPVRRLDDDTAISVDALLVDAEASPGGGAVLEAEGRRRRVRGAQGQESADVRQDLGRARLELLELKDRESLRVSA